MEDKGQNKRRQLTKKEQDIMVPKTQTCGLNGNVGFGSKILPDGTRSGGATILRSDGKYHTETLEELAKQNIYPL